MSPKSFDKFCETLILSDPGSRKEIIDERQKTVRSKLLIEALLIYVVGSFVNTVIMDRAYQWCDNFFAPMVILAAICYIYWIFRSHFSGALFGVNGTFSAKISSSLVIVQSFFWGTRAFFELVKGELECVRDGMLTAEFVCGISFILFLVSAVAILIFAGKTEKTERCDEEKKG